MIFAEQPVMPGSGPRSGPGGHRISGEKRNSENMWSARQGRGKDVFCGGSVLLRYSTGVKNGFDKVLARETLIYGQVLTFSPELE
jgi:hypothetical protein